MGAAAKVLNLASVTDDPIKRAVLANISYSMGFGTTKMRKKKPFNPFLG